MTRRSLSKFLTSAGGVLLGAGFVISIFHAIILLAVWSMGLGMGIEMTPLGKSLWALVFIVGVGCAAAGLHLRYEERTRPCTLISLHDTAGPNTDSYYVEGGIYTDFTFTEIEPGTAESYGPMPYAEAYEKWQSRARFMVDTACHRLVIRPA